MSKKKVYYRWDKSAASLRKNPQMGGNFECVVVRDEDFNTIAKIEGEDKKIVASILHGWAKWEEFTPIKE